MLEETFEMRPNAKCYLFIETDSYVFWDNLAEWLKRLDSNKPWYIGSEVASWGITYAHGGSGYILSHAAMNKLLDPEQPQGLAESWDNRMKGEDKKEGERAKKLKEDKVKADKEAKQKEEKLKADTDTEPTTAKDEKSSDAKGGQGGAKVEELKSKESDNGGKVEKLAGEESVDVEKSEGGSKAVKDKDAKTEVDSQSKEKGEEKVVAKPRVDVGAKKDDKKDELKKDEAKKDEVKDKDGDDAKDFDSKTNAETQEKTERKPDNFGKAGCYE